MELYTQRHGMRSPLKRTYTISLLSYEILFNICENYKKNLTHLFSHNSYDDFTCSEYLEFNENTFEKRIRLKIPDLFVSDYGRISIPNEKDSFNQFALLDYIEFFANNIEDINESWNNERYKNYKYIDCLGTKTVYKDFQKEINDVFVDAGLLYELNNHGYINRIVENSPLTQEIENSINTIQEDETRKLLKEAINLYRSHYLEAPRDAAEKIWDAFERLKTYYTSLDKKKSAEKIVNDMSNNEQPFADLFDAEFKALTDIGNKYRIRHHETDKIDVTDYKHYDYFFNRCLSLIALAIQYLK